MSVPAILAAVVGDPAVASLPRDTPLLSGGLALDSVTVVRLLAEVRAATGVDVADLDLDLDALATIGTLTDFVAAHGNSPRGRPVEAAMRIGMVGAGNIGGTLATLFTRVGHDVALANSRGPETLAGVVAELGPRAHAATVADAAAFGELVVVATPLSAYPTLPADAFAGRIVVDANNYYPSRDGHIAELDARSTTSTELLARRLPGARVVKAFNTINFAHLRDRGRPDAPAADRYAIPIAGDDAAAKAMLTGLIDEIGFSAVDTGTLADSWRQEPGAPVYGAEVQPDQAVALIAQARR